MQDQDVAIELSSLQSELPSFFTYNHNGKKVNILVLRIQDTVSTYLDACMTCYPHKQGYRYDDGSVTCRYCNMKFSICRLGKGIGGCYPIRTEGHRDKTSYRIAVKMLEAAANRF